MANQSWDSYPATYRTEEVEILAEWIRRGCSGSVIGIAGAGKSNLLGFLCHRPEVIHAHWEKNNTIPTSPVALIEVNLDNLPADDLATFYRVILRSFYEKRDTLSALCCRSEGNHALPPERQASSGTTGQLSTLQQEITELYQETKSSLDPFLCQSAVHSLLSSFREQSIHVVFVMNRFEEFCEIASPQMLTALRGLHHKFKGILSYLIGMCREVDYLADIDGLQKLHHLLDTHICRVGPMNEADARLLIAQEMHLVPQPPEENEQEQLLALTGRYPALLKAACHWWLTIPDEARSNNQWADMLLIEPSIQSRLAKIWQGLSQEEQSALSGVQGLQNNPKNKAKAWQKLTERHHHVLQLLEAKGLCQRQELGWRLFSPLLSGYIAQRDGPTHGRIWYNENSEQFYQGQSIIEGLPPKEWKLLHFFVKNPHTRHTKTEIIINVWTKIELQQGITDESLYRIIRELRKQIEPFISSKKYIYIINWRATKPQEGGYKFYPAGRS